MNDERNIKNGWNIPTRTYSDQPYVVKTDDGAWLCVMTTGTGHEGAPGQHIIATRSTDGGRTWSEPIAVDPPSGPEASYAVLLKVPSGRVYVFYNHNTDDVRWVRADNPPYKDGKCYRVDSQGYFVFKYSDDGGQTWSDERYPIDVRETEIDRQNPYGGEIRYFWNVGRPFTHEGAAFVSLHKVGGLGEGFFTSSEGVLLKSDNILTESDPEKIRWETLPDGDAGLRTPPGGGPVAEEQSYSVLSDGSFFCVYRTIDGHPAYAYSRDGGHTWTEPRYMHFADGRIMKHPRAANFAWKCENGHFLYWFHHHGGRFILEHPNRRTIAYEDRNPVWLCGGVEVDSPEGRVIAWSQPEIALYDDDPYIRMSYPDLVEEGGAYYLTETQKDAARVHKLDNALVEGMWDQFEEGGTVTEEGLLLELSDGAAEIVDMPELPAFTRRDRSRDDYGTEDLRAGFTVEMWTKLDSLEPGQFVLDSRTENGQGLALVTTELGTVEIVLNDGRTENRWDCDPNLLEPGKLHHITAIIDGGPKVIVFIVDGAVCDGGIFRQFGWGRYNPNLRHANGRDKVVTGPMIKALRIYGRALRTSEVIANFKAGI